MPGHPDHTPPKSFDQFLAQARAGFIYTGVDGRIIFANSRACEWLKASPDEVLGTKLSDYFPIARKVYYETHLAPLLRMQGFFDEVAIELLKGDGAAIPIFLSAAERHDKSGRTTFVCFTAYLAVERRKYERNLVSAKNVVSSDNSRLREQLAEDGRARLAVEERLSSAENAATLREQFIAVLGHDLRNPLAAIDGAMRLIAKTPLNERATGIVAMVHQSTARMADLIDNVMDFARGRLGGGLTVNPKKTDLVPVLQHIVDELAIAWPSRQIVTDLDVSDPVYCDGKRIAQLLSNLLANALVHGAAEGPVRVQAKIENNVFTLAVCNTGIPIPPEAMQRLFEPFTREDIRPSQQGLGLGLYIASEIARAHAGTLSVESTIEATCFSLKMPSLAAPK